MPWFAVPTEGHLSFLRREAQETAVIQIRTAMITFALFMVREIYCKLNSILGDSLRIERISDGFYSKGDKKSGISDEDATFIKTTIQEQQSCRLKAKHKLPSWLTQQCLFATVPLEQCTSERISSVKAHLFGGEKLLSLTGGLGVDDHAFARSFDQITSIDTDTGLNAIVRFNQARMGIDNVTRLDMGAEEFLLQHTSQWSCVYVDPDRRPDGNRIMGNTAAYSPDVFTLYKSHCGISRRWLIKLSPMTDIQWFQKQVDCHVKMYVFSYKNEIREMLAEIGSADTTETCIVEVNDIGFSIIDNDAQLTLMASEKPIFCELTAAAIKAGFKQHIIEQSGLTPINKNSYYLTGNAIIPHALGRSFILEHTFSGSLGEIEKQIKLLGILKANVSARDFILPAEEARKKLGLKDGGEMYLFLTGKDKIKTCFVARKPD